MPTADPRAQVVALVDRVRERQQLDGCIPCPQPEDERLIIRLINELTRQSVSIPGLTPALLSATLADLWRWLQKGLDQRPLFDATLAEFGTPEPDAAFFFMAPMRATNGPAPEGYRLELVSGVRRESHYLAHAAQYTQHYVAPFQCIQLGAASQGFREGNCIVLFPESVAAECAVDKQAFALFFFSKFSAIYREQTVREVDRLLGPHNGFLFGALCSRHLDEADMYAARCLWGYYHDYAHHTGPRPLDKNLYLKLNWFTGLLEETKCDLIVVRLLHRHRPAFWQAIIEFIVFERLFRYPQGSHQHLTFDAGTGILLFEMLLKAGALFADGSGYLHFDTPRLVQEIEVIISQIEALEGLDDQAYVTAARDYVHRHLGAPLAEHPRFNFPESQYARRVLGARIQFAPL